MGRSDRCGLREHRRDPATSLTEHPPTTHNALAESFNATMKREVLQDAACWTDELTCRRQVFRWLVRYNTRRRHTWCGYLSPSTYEARRAATLATAA